MTVTVQRDDGEGKLMRRMGDRLKALVIALCVALAFVSGGVARAVENYTFSLTVNATTSTDEAFVAEVKKADLVLDVYRIASAEKDSEYDAYHYLWDVDSFTSLEAQFQAVSANRESKASDWAELYDAAAKIVTAGKLAPDQTVRFSNGEADATLDARGIYLVIARGANEGYGTGAAKSGDYEFVFPATMVTAPTKWSDSSGDMAGIIYTDEASGAWHDEATINLKPSYEKVPEPEPPKKRVKTGDDRDALLLPLYVIMAVSGVALAGLAGYVAWLRRKEGEPSELTK